MTGLLYGSADMRADWCNQGDEVCDVAQPCTICELVICPEHADEFTTCVADVDQLHHLDCEKACPDCVDDMRDAAREEAAR